MKKALIIIGLITIASTFSYAATEAPDDINLYKKQGHHSTEWDQLVETGFSAFNSKNYPTAYVFLQKSYDRGCRDGLVLYKLAFINEMKGKYAEAAKVMEIAHPKLKKDYPNHEITKSIDEHLGRIYYQTDQYDKALTLLDNALKTDPNNFMLLFITGQIYRGKKNNEEAYARYSRALTAPPPADVKPSPVLTLLKELMAITYEMKNFDESMKYAEKILAIDPNDQVAKSYQQQIKQSQQKQKQDSELNKLLEQYKR